MVELDSWHYLLVLAACLVITAPLELAGARIYRQPRRALLAVAPVSLVFITWDAIAIATGVWWFNPRFLTGVALPVNIPLEELLFFLVIPLCALLTYDTLERLFQREQGVRRRSNRQGVR